MVSHQKLEIYEIPGSLLNLIKSFLSRLLHFINVGQSLPPWMPSLNGVIQGSCMAAIILIKFKRRN
jgi:hypothetical protein